MDTCANGLVLIIVINISAIQCKERITEIPQIDINKREAHSLLRVDLGMTLHFLIFRRITIKLRVLTENYIW